MANLIKAKSSSEVIFLMNDLKVVFNESSVTMMTAVATESRYNFSETMTPRTKVAIKAKLVVMPVVGPFPSLGIWQIHKNKMKVPKATINNQGVNVSVRL